MLWLLRRGVDGYVTNATASVFTLIYVPFLGPSWGCCSPRAVRSASTAGTTGSRASSRSSWSRSPPTSAATSPVCCSASHPMAPVISPKKSWEGFAGSAVCASSWVGVRGLPPRRGLVGRCAPRGDRRLMATLGDLCESVIKRDLGIKDMSQIVPGHGGLMDRLDSLLATVAPDLAAPALPGLLERRRSGRRWPRRCPDSSGGGLRHLPWTAWTRSPTAEPEGPHRRRRRPRSPAAPAAGTEEPMAVRVGEEPDAPDARSTGTGGTVTTRPSPPSQASSPGWRRRPWCRACSWRPSGSSPTTHCGEDGRGGLPLRAAVPGHPAGAWSPSPSPGGSAAT